MFSFLFIWKKKKVSFSFSFSVRRRHLRPEHSTHPFTFMMGTGFKITTHFREGFGWTNMYSSLAYIVNYFILHGICALKLSGILFYPPPPLHKNSNHSHTFLNSFYLMPVKTTVRLIRSVLRTMMPAQIHSKSVITQ